MEMRSVPPDSTSLYGVAFVFDGGSVATAAGALLALLLQPIARNATAAVRAVSFAAEFLVGMKSPRGWGSGVGADERSTGSTSDRGPGRPAGRRSGRRS